MLGQGLDRRARVGVEEQEDLFSPIPRRGDRRIGRQRVPDDREHEGHEGLARSPRVRAGDRLVVAFLTVSDHALDRQPRQCRAPVRQQQRVPQAPRAAVAIREGVDELEFVVEDAGGRQRVQIGRGHPGEQIRHDLGDVAGRCAGVDEPSFFEDARVPRAVPPGVIDESAHHDAVGAQQVVGGEGVQIVHEPVGAAGVVHLEDLPGGAEDALAVEDRRDGLARERVPLDHEGGVDGGDAQLAMQHGTRAQGGRGAECADELGDLHAQCVDFGRAHQRRLMGHAGSSDPICACAPGTDARGA